MHMNLDHKKVEQIKKELIDHLNACSSMDDLYSYALITYIKLVLKVHNVDKYMEILKK